MYIRPFTTSRMITVRLPPPVLPGGISGSTSLHSSSVRSLGYRNLLRSYRARFWLVHIGDPSSNQATILESQMIHMIQELFGQTLRQRLILRCRRSGQVARGQGHGTCARGAVSPPTSGKDRALAPDPEKSHSTRKLLPARRSRTADRSLRRAL